MTTTTDYLAWLDAKLDAAASDLADLRTFSGPGFADAAAHLVDLMTARTVLREFIRQPDPQHPRKPHRVEGNMTQIQRPVHQGQAAALPAPGKGSHHE